MKYIYIVLSLLIPSIVYSAPTGEVSSYYQSLATYAHIASVAYCIKDGLESGKLGLPETGCSKEVCQSDDLKNIEIIKTFNFNDLGDVGSGLYGVDHDKERILLVFRGTASTRDWVGNIDTFPVKYEPIMNYDYNTNQAIECNGCRVHRGFYTFLKTNCPQIISEVIALKEKHPGYKLVVLGHSLGAALTLLTGIEFQLMGLNPLVISYAGPKVGNSDMTNFVNEIFSTQSVNDYIDETGEIDQGLIRVVHSGDIVPKLPPLGSFDHCGVEFRITKKELPHEASDIEKSDWRASSQLSEAEIATFNGIGPGKLWPNSLGKYEHAHYFVRMTGCGDEN